MFHGYGRVAKNKLLRVSNNNDEDEGYDDHYDPAYDESFKVMIWWVIKDLLIRISLGFVIAFYILPYILSF